MDRSFRAYRFPDRSAGEKLAAPIAEPARVNTLIAHYPFFQHFLKQTADANTVTVRVASS